MSVSEPEQQPTDRPEETFLTQEERDTVKRILSKPEEFPRELGSWIQDYMGTNGFFQKSQVQGLPLLNTQVQEALETLQQTVTAISVIGTTYTAEGGGAVFGGDAGTAQSPSVTVPAGTYYCVCTGVAEISSGAGYIQMRMWNGPGSAAFGSTAVVSETNVQPAPGSGPYHTLISIGSTTVTAQGAISMWANEGGNGNRFIYNTALVAVRTA